MSWKGTGNRARRAALRAQIAEMPPFRRITGPTSAQRIKSCLRAALNKAIAARKIVFNPAVHVEVAPATRAQPLMWTPERVATWRRTGIVPGKVMVRLEAGRQGSGPAAASPRAIRARVASPLGSPAPSADRLTHRHPAFDARCHSGCGAAYTSASRQAARNSGPTAGSNANAIALDLQ
ncbi:hypothetical protein [Embleya sp. NBC_00896]|uniref:hypothetical protein n=1 Tax=Embleya sp. NBC_00896 TaxID=2975961 RepID=UPI003863B30A|nr:hypothetical protein OG928_15765 [Embleya sp. NBC_00896]